MSGPRDEFLSDEDLDLEHLSTEELDVYWQLWLAQAQATNDLDRASYSHGVFDRDPSVTDLPLSTTIDSRAPARRKPEA